MMRGAPDRSFSDVTPDRLVAWVADDPIHVLRTMSALGVHDTRIGRGFQDIEVAWTRYRPTRWPR